jgi:hypothetical protein
MRNQERKLSIFQSGKKIRNRCFEYEEMFGECKMFVYG